MGISWGFVPIVCAFAALSDKEKKAAAYTAVAFAAVYAVLIALVYYAQITTVRLSALSSEAYGLLSYTEFGLFFNYDLLGYAFMSLSTFFVSFALTPGDRGDGWLKWLLRIRRICGLLRALPALGLFKPGLRAGIMGVLVLGSGAHFTPVSYWFAGISGGLQGMTGR